MSLAGVMLMSPMLPEKVKWIPCGLFVNDSEEKATIAIRNTLNAVDRGQWTILSNLMVSYQPEETPDEIDIVAIGSTAVIAIEVKHWDNRYVAKNPNVVVLVRQISSKRQRGGLKGTMLFLRRDIELFQRSIAEISCVQPGDYQHAGRRVSLNRDHRMTLAMRWQTGFN
ncbi:MAG: hypothetical protein C7B46_07755 [Sulfobacillus benefaciens]|uniref:NERD domain-containing protein n=1 Tax=Sulfobacillus benefaciens TaxID=453960 RepID=A0A2T2XHC1_9FIRM|nr:MAG: hypothetical protein C7B46_07755 [Sulfobacillus benefaciens]